MSALLERSTVSAVVVQGKCLAAIRAQLRSDRPHQLTERDRRVLKCVACQNGLFSVVTLTTEFQTASGSNVSTRRVRRELHEMGFHGRAAHKSLEWCKAHSHRTQEVWKIVLWSDESHFTIWLFFMVGLSPLVPVKGNLLDDSVL
jgi:transposase